MIPIESLRVGRVGGGADGELDDPEVSRAHATIECIGGCFVLGDTGSSNGTFVGEARIETLEIEDRPSSGSATRACC